MTVKIGDKIRIIDADPNEVFYKNGDIFYVSDVWDSGEGVDIGNDDTTVLIELYNREFEVISDTPVAPDNPAYLIANLTERVSEMESVIKRIKEALAND